MTRKRGFIVTEGKYTYSGKKGSVAQGRARVPFLQNLKRSELVKPSEESCSQTKDRGAPKLRQQLETPDKNSKRLRGVVRWPKSREKEGSGKKGGELGEVDRGGTAEQLNGEKTG